MEKKYDVYGIGNALVDVEVKVDDEFLKSMNIEKGLMSLIDKNKQDSLLKFFDSFETSEGRMSIENAVMEYSYQVNAAYELFISFIKNSS